MLNLDPSPFVLFVYALAVIGAHRLWNYEDVFVWTRAAIDWKPLSCRVCNPFWIAVALLPLALSPGWWTLLPVALYGPVRGLVWVYDNLPKQKMLPVPGSVIPADKLPVKPAPGAPGKPPEAPMPAPASPQEETCTPCEAKKKAAAAERARTDAFAKRVVIMSPLHNAHASYSVATCMFDQAIAIARLQPTTLVQIWVCQGFQAEGLPTLPRNVEVKAILPKVRGATPQEQQLMQHTLLGNLLPLGNAAIFTHDMLFVDGLLHWAEVIHKVGQTKAFSWAHICHSGPSSKQTDQPPANRRLPDGHLLICLNSNLREGFAQMYRVPVDRVLAAGNARDLTTLLPASEALHKVLAFARPQDADITMTLPADNGRLAAKGLMQTIDLFAHLKRKALSVRLIVVNAHCSTKEDHDKLAPFIAQARTLGLDEREVCFTSRIAPETATWGLSAQDVFQLFLHSNLFYFPTQGEAASLVCREAALAGNLIFLPDGMTHLREQIPAAIPIRGSDVDARAVFNALGNHMNWCKRSVLKDWNLEAVGRGWLQALEQMQPNP